MSDPHGFLAEHFPRLYLWLTDAQMSAQYLVIGAAASREQFTLGDLTKIVAAVAISAFASSYVTTERTAIKLEQYAAMQMEFRNEVRAYMREHEAKSESLRDRVVHMEATIAPQNGGRK
jgi:hypothetical protein